MNKRLFSPSGYSLRTKLLLSIIGVTVISLAIFWYFAYTRAQQLQAFLTSELQTTVQAQSEQQLKSTVQNEAHNADQSLSEITLAVKELADYRGALYSQPSTLGAGSYWDAHTKLFKQPGGQYLNAQSDTSAVFIPNTVPVLDDALVSDLNASVNLDFSAPGILKDHSNMVALYYMSNDNYVVYYPNFDQSILPPDLSALDLPWYTIALPQNDPERKVLWSDPYQDPAGQGLLVTTSAPVYDSKGAFHGVMAADVQLSKLTENISAIKIAKSGFAFLLDHAGHMIAMPQPGYALFGLQPEVVPINETPKSTLLGKGPTEFQDAVRQMTSGKEGLSIVKIAGVEYDVVYTPLPTIGYSLGAIVPTAEMNETFLAARGNIASETQNTLNLAAILLVVLLLVAAGVSFLLSQNIIKPLAELTQVAQAIEMGDFTRQAKVETTDETGVLAAALNSMTKQLRDLFETLEKRVADRTAIAETARAEAEAAAAEAQAARKDIETQMWLATGQTQLADAIRGEQTIAQLAGNVISQLCRYTGAQAGALFLLKEKTLTLAGRYAFSERPGFDGSFKWGEGLVGQAAADSKIMYLADIPPDTLVISTGLVDLKPRQIVAAPFYMNGEVVGVLELATLSEFTPTHLELWNRISESLGVAFYTTQTRQRLAESLMESQQQAEELQAQEEEVRAANEELQAQAEELQKKEEELRTANEELQAQTETLRAVRESKQEAEA